jgi:hypothetical protein
MVTNILYKVPLSSYASQRVWELNALSIKVYFEDLPLGPYHQED